MAIGVSALADSGVGNENVAVGYQALQSYEGASNTAVGSQSLKANSTGTNNTAVGYGSLIANTTGLYNTAVGYNCLNNNTTSSRNTAVGQNAMSANTTGTYSCAFGVQALSTGTGGNYNHGIGYRALRYCATNSGSNQGVGSLSGDAITTGYGNNLLGYRSGTDITTGYYNTCIGTDAGENITTGYSNQCIGRLAKPSAADGAVQIVIGQQLTGKGNSTAFIGGSLGAYNEANGSSWSTTSDKRIKKNIVNNNSGLDILNQIQIRNFEYKTRNEIINDNPELTDVVESAVVESEGVQLGVIAQELEEILPECVNTSSTGIKTVDSNNITWYLINAIKELYAEVQALKSA